MSKTVHPEEAACICVMWMMILLLKLLPLAQEMTSKFTREVLEVVENAI
jgi:hypothetical protein